MSDPVLDIWRFSVLRDRNAIVIPDGCRDLILRRMPDGAIQTMLSPLTDRTRTVPVEQGTRMIGLRLRPGMLVNEEVLMADLDGMHPDADFTEIEKSLSRALEQYCVSSSALEDALLALQESRVTVSLASRRLGLATRSLQRLVKSGTGRSPKYWIQLARIRRVARAAADHPSLAEIADLHGYADQAHMTRAFRKWLGITPSALKPGSDIAVQLCQSGYG